MNRELMHRVANVIELEDRFNLKHFAENTTTGAASGSPGNDLKGGVSADELLNRCDTTGCVAGWVNALNGCRHLGDDVAARKALGLTEDQAWRLFYGDVWRDMADELGWDGDALEDISSVQAAKMLRWIADGEVEL